MFMKLHQIKSKIVQSLGDVFMSESDPQYTKKAEILADKKISVIGYDNTGRAHAMNLRDSGFDIIVGVRPGKSWERASNDGFEVYPIADAVEISDIISVTLPAVTIPRVYQKFIRDSLDDTKCLIFSDATCLNFEILDIPDGINTFTIFTPKTGEDLRDEYLAGRKIRSYAAPYRKKDEICMKTAQEYANGLGSSGDHFFVTKMSEIACAQIFAETHLSDFLEKLINSGIKALGEEIFCTELSGDVIAETFRIAAENVAGCKKTPGINSVNDSLSKTEVIRESEEQMSEWVYQSKSGLTFKKSLLSGM